MAKEKVSMRRKSAVIMKWRASGLTQAEFCRAEGLQQWQLSDWKRVVASQSDMEMSNVIKDSTEPTRQRKPKRRRQQPDKETFETSDFVPVRLIQAEPEQSNKLPDFVIEVQLRGGHVMRVASDCSPEFLGSLVAALNC